MSSTGYELMAMDDTGPYRWPNHRQWKAMDRRERLATAHRLVALAEQRRWAGMVGRSMAQRDAAQLLLDAEATPIVSVEVDDE